jgi:hypothetical protein
MVKILMRYIIRYLEERPTPHLVVFGSSNNLAPLKEVDFEKTQIVDTETGEIMSPLGERSEEYGKAYKRKDRKK